MRRTVGPEDIKKMNEAYAACGTYNGAAAATGWSASTVRKYIIPGYKSEQNFEVDSIELPPIDEIADRLPPWYDLTCLTPEEERELKFLWKEMLI